MTGRSPKAVETLEPTLGVKPHNTVIWKVCPGAALAGAPENE